MKTPIATPNAPQAVGPYSQAMGAGNFVFFSGQIPLDPRTGEIVGNDVASQVEQVLNNVEALLGDAGLTTDNVVKSTIFLVDMNDFATVNEAYAKRFNAPFPARSTIQVAALPKGALVEIEVIAVRS